MDIKYKTGFFPITDMHNKSIIRRVNINYESAAELTCKLYTDGDTGTARATLSYPANSSSGSKLLSIRPAGVRAKTVLMDIYSDAVNSSSAVTINKVELETDE